MHIAAGLPKAGQIIARLIALGCDVHLKDDAGISPIATAAQQDLFKNVSILAGFGANPHDEQVFEAALLEPQAPEPCNIYYPQGKRRKRLWLHTICFEHRFIMSKV